MFRAVASIASRSVRSYLHTPPAHPLAAMNPRTLATTSAAQRDKTPGVPPKGILKEYEEHRVEEREPAEASIQGEHTFTHPKVSA